MIAEVETLQKIIAEKDSEIIELRFDHQRLKLELEQLKRMIFGSKSERFVADVPGQLSLDIASGAAENLTGTVVVDQHERKKNRKKKPVREAFPASLAREIITIYPEGYDENTAEKPIGKEVTEILKEIPGKLFVKRYERLKFAKPNNEGVVIGELPSRPIDKGLFGELLLTRIIIDKYCDHLPLYRQLQRLQRAGIKLASSTVGDVPKQVCALLELLYAELVKQVTSSNYLQVDETPHPVLDANVKEKTHRGFLWVYRSVEQKLVLFDYRKGRGREGPRELLTRFKGYLQSDGYAVYDEFDAMEGITSLGCMAHARRYFEKALNDHKELAEYFLHRAQVLYAVEREIREKEYNDEKIVELRGETSLPVLSEIEAWLKEQIMHVTPKSPIGKVVAYSLSRWEKLTSMLIIHCWK